MEAHDSRWATANAVGSIAYLGQDSFLQGDGSRRQEQPRTTIFEGLSSSILALLRCISHTRFCKSGKVSGQI